MENPGSVHAARFRGSMPLSALLTDLSPPFPCFFAPGAFKRLPIFGSLPRRTIGLAQLRMPRNRIDAACTVCYIGASATACTGSAEVFHA